MEPTEENLRAWNRLHRQRTTARAGEPAIPAQIRELLPELAGKHVLHQLCATGEASAELAAHGALVTGIDSWGEALVSARERFPNVVFVQADIHEQPVQLRRRRFDLVYAGAGTLRYLHDLDQWAAGVVSALRPGGTLLLWDTHPALECLDLASLRWREDYFDDVLVVTTRLHEPREVRLWRFGEIVTGIASAGLVVRRIEEFPSLSTVRRHDPRAPGEFALLADKP